MLVHINKKHDSGNKFFGNPLIIYDSTFRSVSYEASSDKKSYIMKYDPFRSLTSTTNTYTVGKNGETYHVWTKKMVQSSYDWTHVMFMIRKHGSVAAPVFEVATKCQLTGNLLYYMVDCDGCNYTCKVHKAIRGSKSVEMEIQVEATLEALEIGIFVSELEKLNSGKVETLQVKAKIGGIGNENKARSVQSKLVKKGLIAVVASTGEQGLEDWEIVEEADDWTLV